MNDEREVNENKDIKKAGSNNIFLLSNTSHTNNQSPSKNIFLLPSEEERNRSNHLQSKFSHSMQGIFTFSDYSADDTFFENSQNDAFKDIYDNKTNTLNQSNSDMKHKPNGGENEDDYESSYANHSYHSHGPFFVKPNRNLSSDSNASEDENTFDCVQSGQMRKLNSHQAIQMPKMNPFLPPASNKEYNSTNNFYEHNSKQKLLSETLRSKINNTSNALKTFHLITKRKYRSTGRSAHYVFTDGENILFNIYQSHQQVNLFEVYTDVQAPIFAASSSGVKSALILPKKNLNETETTQINRSKSSIKSTQIQTAKSITSTNLASHVPNQNLSLQITNPPVATLHMIDNKGSQFLFYKNNTNGELILKIQYIKTSYTGYYRSTIVTFHKKDSCKNVHPGIPSQHYFSEPQSATSSTFELSGLSSESTLLPDNENKKQRLWSKQPALNDEGKPEFSCPGNRFFFESIRNMNLCKKNQDRIFISVRKTDQNELEIDTYFRANLLWLVGIALSDVLSSVY